MLFHTPGFLFIFLPLFLVSFYSLPTGTPRRLVIFLFSYLFYSGSHPFFALLLLVSSVVDYEVALRIDRARAKLSKKLLLTISILINLGMLGFYKYGAMVLELISPTLTYLNIPIPADENFFKSFALPAGISFYTFQSMSYSIDVYRGLLKPERNFIGFCNYVAYLPQLIAGPIERFGHLYHQLAESVNGKLTPHWQRGVNRLALGVVQKLLIADSCGRLVDILLVQRTPLPLVDSWAVAIGFGLQIFYDFSAYTHMAIGISLMLGVELRENFLSPYQARNVQDFWRRWHITLSTWFRDYVYLPLGGSRGSFFRTCSNLFITFLVSGLWHGAGWNFVLWGALHGAYIVAYHLVRKFREAALFPRPLSVFITFVAVHYAWILFRIPDMNKAMSLWAGMSGMNGVHRYAVSLSDLTLLLLFTALTQIIPNSKERAPGASGTLESFFLIALAVLALFISPEVSQFIYFQF